MKKLFNDLVARFGLPKVIIVLFLSIMLIIAPFAGNNVIFLLSTVIDGFVCSGVLALSMVPMVHSGCGLNFGLPVGIIAGLIGATLTIELGFTGLTSFFMAILLSLPFAIILGVAYGLILNKIKGGEMMIATYVGFSIVSLMCIGWLALPYSAPTMIHGLSGEGLRSTITLDGYYAGVLSNFLKIQIGDFVIPTGSLLFFGALCLFVDGFLHTKTGTAMTAVGSNPHFARAAGINIDKIRLLSTVMSTVLAAIGIIVYEQGFGYIQLYMAPFSMAMPVVAALLIGGASVNKCSISNVIVGEILYQGFISIVPTVLNSIIKLDISDCIRNIISNGVILYALTRKTDEGKKK